ncbi:hypothetical protein [Nocardia aurea]|uniref:hypothetical protein n=1 Tax=Nocardia aurea TaxID=2144174 RepID=UPI0018E547BD|nr:hypothetical protein [Nocardia aurea]
MIEKSEVVVRLVQASAEYDAMGADFYDEIFDQVAARIAESGSVGKLDLAALVTWKRLRADAPWVTALMRLPDQRVRACTCRAVVAVNDPSLSVADAAHLGRQVLLELPGGRGTGAFPSAVLTAAAPQRMAVYDWRARQGLQRLGIPFSTKGGSTYRRYMIEVEMLRGLLAQHNQHWTARKVDLALFMLGRN